MTFVFTVKMSDTLMYLQMEYQIKEQRDIHKSELQYWGIETVLLKKISKIIYPFKPYVKTPPDTRVTDINSLINTVISIYPFLFYLG